MRNKLLDELARKGNVFTFTDAKDSSLLDANSLRVLLHRLEKRGYIERLEREKYMIIPLGASKNEYSLHEFILGSVLVDPSCISYWSALNYYGMTEQIPSVIFIQTTGRKKNNSGKVLGVDYRIVRISDWKFFGLKQIWIEGERINITDEEKTILDCLDRPDLCGGIVEAVKGLTYEKIDQGKLKEYSLRMKNSGIIRRLGYLFELLDIDHDLEPIDTRNYLFLDPTMPKKGDIDPKWKLIINIDPLK